MMNAASSSVTDTAVASLMEISTVTDTHSSIYGTISPTTTTPILSAMMESASASVEPSPSSTLITRPPSSNIAMYTSNLACMLNDAWMHAWSTSGLALDQ